MMTDTSSVGGDSPAIVDNSDLSRGPDTPYSTATQATDDDLGFEISERSPLNLRRVSNYGTAPTTNNALANIRRMGLSLNRNSPLYPRDSESFNSTFLDDPEAYNQVQDVYNDHPGAIGIAVIAFSEDVESSIAYNDSLPEEENRGRLKPLVGLDECSLALQRSLNKINVAVIRQKNPSKNYLLSVTNVLSTQIAPPESVQYFFVYIIGHGANRVFFTKDGSIAYSELYQQFQQNRAWFRQRFFFFDCCRSFRVDTLSLSPNRTGAAPSFPDLNVDRNDCIVFSTTSGNQSFGPCDGGSFMAREMTELLLTDNSMHTIISNLERIMETQYDQLPSVHSSGASFKSINFAAKRAKKKKRLMSCLVILLLLCTVPFFILVLRTFYFLLTSRLISSNSQIGADVVIVSNGEKQANAQSFLSLIGWNIGNYDENMVTEQVFCASFSSSVIASARGLKVLQPKESFNESDQFLEPGRHSLPLNGTSNNGENAKPVYLLEGSIVKAKICPHIGNNKTQILYIYFISNLGEVIDFVENNILPASLLGSITVLLSSGNDFCLERIYQLQESSYVYIVLENSDFLSLDLFATTIDKIYLKESKLSLVDDQNLVNFDENKFISGNDTAILLCTAPRCRGLSDLQQRLFLSPLNSFFLAFCSLALLFSIAFIVSCVVHYKFNVLYVKFC